MPIWQKKKLKPQSHGAEYYVHKLIVAFIETNGEGDKCWIKRFFSNRQGEKKKR